MDPLFLIDTFPRVTIVVARTTAPDKPLESTEHRPLKRIYIYISYTLRAPSNSEFAFITIRVSQGGKGIPTRRNIPYWIKGRRCYDDSQLCIS